ncbi:MAG: acyl-ACP--UDP-N-acetylglucosamine O-acyltransferase [Myxococcota bacterium]|nr:acyl-ACP--UDP-N-acetylglucosamine O-acyltransferase [Myxococcota bacterium]
MPRIHPTAVVDPAAKLAEDVEVGPLACVGAGVELGPGVVVENHASVTGLTRVGRGSRIYPFAAVGGEPQDLKWRGEQTRLEIGASNRIRENATIHVGTEGGLTVIGDDNLIMNGAHLGHDVRVGSHTVVGSFCGIGGHVEIHDHARLGAFTGVHQFARIGESVMTAANSMLSQDAPPFSLVAGDRAHLVGINSIGLRRRDVSSETIAAIKHAFHVLFRSKLKLRDAIRRVRGEGELAPEVESLLQFLESATRGFCR